MKKRRASSIMHIASRTTYGPTVARPATAHRRCPVGLHGDPGERHIALQSLLGPSFTLTTGVVSSVDGGFVAFPGV